MGSKCCIVNDTSLLAEQHELQPKAGNPVTCICYQPMYWASLPRGGNQKSSRADSFPMIEPAKRREKAQKGVFDPVPSGELPLAYSLASFVYLEGPADSRRFQ